MSRSATCNNQIVTVGEEIQVVLDLNGEEGRVSLSLKATTPGPWDGVEQKLAAGDVIEGTVKRLTDDFDCIRWYCRVSTDLYTSHKFHTNVLKIKDVLKLDRE